MVVACFDILRILTRVDGIAVESVLKSFDSEYISQTPFTCEECDIGSIGSIQSQLISMCN